MNPKPFESLNHFTVPVGMSIPFLTMRKLSELRWRARYSREGSTATRRSLVAASGSGIDSLLEILRVQLYHARPLFGTDSLFPDDPAPAHVLRPDEGAELLRRAADRLRAEPGEALAHFRQAQHLGHLPLQPRDDPGRRT